MTLLSQKIKNLCVDQKYSQGMLFVCSTTHVKMEYTESLLLSSTGQPWDINLSGSNQSRDSGCIQVYRSFQGILYLKGKEQIKKLEEFWISGTLVKMEIKIKGKFSRFQS